jgi:SAM-dependent methyltransferase
MSSSEGVWGNHSKQWARVGPPLRPSKQDHEILEKVIHNHTPKNNTPRALVLGVSPEMAHLNWPKNTELIAVDHSQEMIDNVWPGYPNPGEGVLCANWLNMPFQQHSKDIVVSDGPFGVLRYPNEYKQLLTSLERVINPNGIFAFRVFIKPEEPETPQQIYKDAIRGKIGNFHVFKLRLLMAMQPDLTNGVCTGNVWREWHENGPDVNILSEECGWPIEQINTIEAYRGQKDVYSFPTIRELRGIFSEKNFKEIEYSIPTYELGERCPTFVYKPQPLDL